MLTFDILFSNWIILWYILYIFKLVKYNPKGWLIIAFILNFYNVFLMAYFNRYYMLFLFILVIFITKVVPIWTLRNTTSRMIDYIAGFVLLSIYYGWLTYNNYSLNKLATTTYPNIQYNKLNATPYMNLLNNLNLNIFKIY